MPNMIPYRICFHLIDQLHDIVSPCEICFLKEPIQ